jgi:acid phosphatase family membrane protein YuiD
MDYKLVLVPFLALIITQLIKVIIDAAKGKFSWNDLNSYGGWPSSHSAMVAALCTEIGLATGFNTAFSAISLAFTFLIIRDAVGLRWELGRHAKIINMLIKDLPDFKEAKYPFLQERLGHTYLQALSGIVIGILISLLI